MQALGLTFAITLLCGGLLLNMAVLLFVLRRSLRSLRPFGGQQRGQSAPSGLAPAHR